MRTTFAKSILVLMTISQAAQSFAQNNGFQGAAPFQNPYSDAPPPPPGADNFFGEEDFDVPKSDTGARGGRGAESGSARGHSAGGGSGMSMGGADSVVSKNKVSLEKIDSDSGEGSKAVVTDFNFPDADILDIAKTLGKLTGKNFILDKDVKGKITIVSNSPITVGDAWRAFLTALDMNGFALIPSGKYIRIGRQRDARDKQAKIYTGDYSPDSDALITRIFALKYISSDEVARTFRSIMPPNARIIPYEQTNSLIVTDTGANIAKLAKLLDVMDIEGYDVGIEVINVKFASAAELAKLIDTLLPGTSAGARGGTGARTGARTSTGSFAARKTKEGGIINAVIADERTNTLIVHANSRGVEKVRELVLKLDQKVPAPAGGGRVHVVYLQFAEAEQIANTLNGISSGAGGSTAPRTGGGAGTGSNPVQASLFEGNIKVSPDKATNSLVVTASPGDFVTVQRVIQKLDIPRDEVYVEGVIMETSIQKDFELSANIVLPSSGIGFLPNATDLGQFLTNPISQKGVVMGFKSGRTQNIPINGVQVPVANMQGLIKAIQTHSNGNVLATPQILTMDNTEATFESGEGIPVPQAQAVQGAGVSQGFTRERIVLSLKLKPQINKISNMIKLDVETKLSDISNREITQPQTGGAVFGTTERTAKTTITVADGDTAVMGGLIRDKVDKTVSKVPLLGDIPLLGWLFRSTRSASSKSNLMIFITPTIMRQYEKVRAMLDEKLKERDQFIEKNAGGDDPTREYRDQMIKKLPSVETITSYAPKKFDSLPSGNDLESNTPGSGSTPATAPSSDSSLLAPPPNIGVDMGMSPSQGNFDPLAPPPGNGFESPPPILMPDESGE